MPYMNKKTLAKNENLVKTRLRMYYEWIGKTSWKKSNPENRKNSENQSETAACEQKTSSEKAKFCSNTIFSIYFKIRAEKFHAAKPLNFSPEYLFRRDRNHYSNLTSKIMKMCEQILKKHSRKNSESGWSHYFSYWTINSLPPQVWSKNWWNLTHYHQEKQNAANFYIIENVW